ncbi:RNA polymerase sigma factor [Anatilimnocola aggregata]|uniref:RNA polymerase sigma factor n=1 Tax=Anatilimnocola aggregata TaxID=2528021 RepID=UPI001EE40A2C|nr:RNA polymerase sigma factor [Anatilimnocola aggregata]
MASPSRKAVGSDTAVQPATRPARSLEDAFALHQSELLGTLYYLVGNLEDARDALQEAFVKCWKHQDQVEGVQNLKAWIFRIALNTGRDLRETAWRRKRQGLPEDENSLAGNQLRPDEIVEHDERMQRLRSAMQLLREEEKEVFLLRQNGELTYEEIAEALGIPSGTVKTRMRLALARLREVLAEG